MGLPASGKTSLAKQLQAYYSDSDYMHISVFSYDDFMAYNCDANDHSVSTDYMDVHREFRHISGTSTSNLSTNISSFHSKNLTWKEERNYILKLVEDVILFLLGLSQWIPCLASSNGVERKCDLCSCFNQVNPLPPNKSHVIVIDDNMFYRSMRYSYFQIACRFQVSYCQIYLKIKLEDALKRNTNRGNGAVKTETISKMAFVFEEPDTNFNHWEKQSLILSCYGEDDSLHHIVNFIEMSFQNVAQSLCNHDNISNQCSKQENLKNSYHQIDILLRKHVSTSVAKLKTNSNDNLLFSNNAKILNRKRKIFFNLLRSNEGFCDSTGLEINLNIEAGDILSDAVKDKVVRAFYHFVEDS